MHCSAGIGLRPETSGPVILDELAHGAELVRAGDIDGLYALIDGLELPPDTAQQTVRVPLPGDAKPRMMLRRGLLWHRG